MLRMRDKESLEGKRQRRAAAELNSQCKIMTDLKKEAVEANRLLKKRKQEIVERENRLASSHTLKTYSIDQLGQGHAKGGTAACRTRRHEVLDRMARNGIGLSVGQRNDWNWFKQAWDETMAREYTENWGGKFAEWIQGVIDRFKKGEANAFSVFVHSESSRCLHGERVLQVL